MMHPSLPGIVQKISNLGLAFLDDAEREIITGAEPNDLASLGVSGEVLDRMNNTQALVDAKPDVDAFNETLNELLEPAMDNMAKTKKFNLKKAQGFPPPAVPTDPFGAETSPEGFALEQQDVQEGQLEEPHFSTAAELMTYLDTVDSSTVFNTLAGDVPEDQEVVLEDGQTTVNARSHLKDAVEAYYDPMLEHNPGAAREKETAANQMMQVLPHTESGVEATYKEGPGLDRNSDVFSESKMYKKIIENANKEIKQQAEQAAKSVKISKGFNLSKTAQQKTLDNALLWGPDEKRFDPFYRQPVSDWHIVERNKGFGLTLDDVWNIDYEAIWRGTIMDKYSRPYRDKDGNWVGGYIQKRFEVDKWIPETSNMQLKPGQKRKPRPPEYGVLESRLQANRAEDNRGYGPNSDTSAPFNWLEASKKGNVKTAIGPIMTKDPDRIREVEEDIEKAGNPPQDVMDEMGLIDPAYETKEEFGGHGNAVRFGISLADKFIEDPDDFRNDQGAGYLIDNKDVRTAFEGHVLTRKGYLPDVFSIVESTAAHSNNKMTKIASPGFLRAVAPKKKVN